MKFLHILILGFLIGQLSLVGHAQKQCRDCGCMLQKAQAYAARDSFERAIDQYNAARGHCPEDRFAEINEKVLEVFQRMNALREQAEVMKLQAIKDREQAVRLRNVADSARIEAQEKETLAKRQIEKNKNLIDAFYFYEDSLALAFDGFEWGYVDKNGTAKIGYQFEKASNFEEPGYSRVVWYGADYLLDPNGNGFLAAFSVDSIKMDVRALALIRERLLDSTMDRFCPEKTRILSIESGGEVFIKPRFKDGRWPRYTPILNKLSYFSSLEILSLSYTEFKSENYEFPEIKTLKRLNWHSNEPDSLPKHVERLENLIVLKLRFNGLKKWPKGVEELSNLTRLDLSYNNIKVIPACIGKLKKLKVFDCHWNPLDSISTEIVNLSNLEYLNFAGDSIGQLPEEIGKLTALKRLDLHGNQLRIVPYSFRNLVALEDLSISSCNFDRLPNEIENLKQLLQLHIGGNPCSDSPEEQAAILNQMAEWLPNCKVYFD